jgi:SSS family solute:Na+ symporter
MAFPLSSGFGGVDLIGYLLLIGLTYVVGPDMYSRLFSARDSKTARISVFWTALFLIPLAFGITLIGMGAFALHPEIAAEQAFPMLITGVLPSVAAAIVLAALVAAIMSSADTTLLSASTILSVDVIGYFRKSKTEDSTLKLSRWGIPVIGLAALGLAFMLQGVITALLFAYTIYTCAVTIPVIAGFYRRSLKITSRAALAAIMGGGTIVVFNKLLSVYSSGGWAAVLTGNKIWMNFSGFIVSLVLLFAVSWIENRLSFRRSTTSISSLSTER